MLEKVALEDPQIYNLMSKEIRRQELGLEMIASENFVSTAVMQAMGSVLTNKYAEGYPGKRYYGGCQFHDEIEALAIERVKNLFGADHANVQPHSGATANFSVYHAAVELGETVLAMNLDHGGHLTHGSSVNFSGRFYNIIPYGVTPEGYIDDDEVMRLALKHQPKMIIAGASAYARIIHFDRFKAAADAVGAKLMVDMAHIAGLVASGHHPSPIPYADYVTSTTHKTLRGPRGGLILCTEKRRKKLDSRVFPGTQGGPLMHVIAAKAVCFKEASQYSFKVYQQNVIDNAQVLASELLASGLDLVSGGTDNHLILIDLRTHTLNGKQAEAALGEVDITVNKNKVPFDPESPFITSGIRIGTPALTSRGMGTVEMKSIAKMIVDTLNAPDDSKMLQKIKAEVLQMAQQFPLYPELISEVS